MLNLEPRQRAVRGDLRPAHRPGVSGREALALVALLELAVLMALYFVARLGGRWAENDTAYFTLVFRAITSAGTLLPPEGTIYPQGYGYAAITSFILALTGVDAGSVQRIIYPLVSAFLVFPAWALYRELTGSHRAATLGTLLLFVQPEFLFVALRGSHERMLRAEMLVCLWLLVRSFRCRPQTVSFAAHVVLFYLVAYALIATNVLFAISFFVAIAVALAGAWFFSRGRSPAPDPNRKLVARFLSVTLIATALGFVFTFDVYAPAKASLRALGTVAQQAAALILTVHLGSNQYAGVATSWVSLPVYFALAIGDYLLLVASLAVWLHQGVRWLRDGAARDRQTSTAWMLWLLYGAFALQGGLAMVADRAGELDNLELREFPSFATVAIPLVAVPLSRWRPARPRALLAGGGVALLAAFALLKATNEPSLSNRWTFYSVPEIQALEWADSHYRETPVWVGLDERLSAAYAVAVGDSINRNRWDSYQPTVADRTFVISEITRLQSARLDRPLPPAAAENQIYDAGQVQIYRLRPRTPYQR